MLKKLVAGLFALIVLAPSFAYAVPPGSPAPYSAPNPLNQRAPRTTDSTSAGFAVGNYWYDLNSANPNGVIWQNQDDTSGVATWTQVLEQVADLGDAIGGVAPQAAYGSVKLFNAYASNAFQVVRASDGTTFNAGFVSQDVPGYGVLQVADWRGVDAFCAGTTCNYSEWYDQSGNANNATQTPATSTASSISGTTLTWGGTTTGTVAIGESVYCPSSLANTVITAGSGSSWTVSQSQTVGSGECIATFGPPVTGVTINGLRVLSVDNNRNASSNPTEFYMTLPSGVATNWNAVSIVVPGRIGGTESIPVELGTSGGGEWFSWFQSALSSGTTNGLWNINTNTIHGSTTPSYNNANIFHAVTSASGVTIYEDDASSNIGAQTSTAMTGGTIGYSLRFGSSYMAKVDAPAFLIYGYGLSATQVATAKRFSYRLIGGQPQNDAQVLSVGDSITDGVCPMDGTNRPALLATSASRPILARNIGTDGSTAQEWSTVSFSSFYNSALKRNVAVVHLGTNDIFLNSSSATQIEGWLTTIWGNLKSAGFQVVATTVLPRAGFTTAMQTQWTALNTWIKANYAQNGAVALADFQANALIGPITAVNPSVNTTYYCPDGTHPTTQGYTVMNGIEGPVVNSLLGSASP